MRLFFSSSEWHICTFEGVDGRVVPEPDGRQGHEAEVRRRRRVPSYNNQNRFIN